MANVGLDDIAIRGLLVALAMGVGLGFYAIVGAIRSNGETDYCFVEMWSPFGMSPQWQLFAHRPWRDDRIIGNFPSLDEAKVKADSIDCKLNTK